MLDAVFLHSKRDIGVGEELLHNLDAKVVVLLMGHDFLSVEGREH